MVNANCIVSGWIESADSIVEQILRLIYDRFNQTYEDILFSENYFFSFENQKTFVWRKKIEQSIDIRLYGWIENLFFIFGAKNYQLNSIIYFFNIDVDNVKKIETKT